jgi:hypothetical protein
VTHKTSSFKKTLGAFFSALGKIISNIVGWFFRLFIVIVVVWGAGSIVSSVSDKLSNITTVYQQHCRDFNTEYSECSKKGFVYDVTSIKFRVDYDKQTVIRHGSLYPTKYKGCIVFDSQNWSCSIDDDLVWMDDGKLYEPSRQPDGKIFTRDIDIPALAYWIHRIKDMF